MVFYFNYFYTVAEMLSKPPKFLNVKELVLICYCTVYNKKNSRHEKKCLNFKLLKYSAVSNHKLQSMTKIAGF